jgi:hypothetical protein
MHQGTGTGTIMPNANTSKVHSQYWMSCSDDENEWCTTLAQRPSWEYAEKLVKFQRHVTKLRKKHVYIPGNTRNANPFTVYFDMQSNVTEAQETRKPELP